MKHLKAKLMAAVAMLLVATVMLTSASFAWFTISTNPEVANLSATLNANQNLEIALDAGAEKWPADSAVGDSGKNETWGNLIDLTTYFENAKIALKPVIATVETGEKSISFDYPKFGLDGRIKEVTDLTRRAVDDSRWTGLTNFADFGGVWAHSDSDYDMEDTVWCFEVDYWLRSNEDQTVSLSEAVKRDDSLDAETGLGSWISNDTVTVAFADATDGGIYYGIPAATAGTDGNYALTLKTKNGTETADATISLTANTPKLLKMYVYLDGEGVTNADMATASENFKMNVQFKTANDLQSLVVHESENGRKTPSAS